MFNPDFFLNCPQNTQNEGDLILIQTISDSD